MSVNILERPVRNYVAEDFKVTDWESLKPYFDELLERPVANKDELLSWFKNSSELSAIVSEDAGWRYINMTRDTTDNEATERYQFFVSQIQPQISPLSDKLNRKVLELEPLKEIDEAGFPVMIRSMKSAVEIFREENVPINVEIRQKAQKYGQIQGAMSIEVDGEEITLQQASVHLKSTDRERRKEVFEKVNERRYQDYQELDDLYSEMIQLRHQIALNAGFENFRDYMFKSLGRFDYTPKDCFEFHEAVKNEVVPLVKSSVEQRKEKLGLGELKPWDTAVDVEGRLPLKPYETGEELIEKSIEVFRRLDPFFGERLEIMKEMGHLDLESRKGKAPGGYNYPLAEIGVPFIFMNAANQMRDVVVMMHEGGHALHSFLVRDLMLNSFKSTPSEVAELASMSMELLSMDHWDVFFDDEAELKRAKQEHLEQLLDILPWVAIIDRFQHWIYEHPGHTSFERKEAWNEIHSSFSSGVVDWSGYEKYKDYMWQRQLHLYEVPFYYIEYAIAQLGAIAVWKNYRENPEQGLKQYVDALKLGYTKDISEIYKTAGVKFDFSQAYIKELMEFVKGELEAL